MKRIGALLWELFHIFFRHYNFPCELGLRRVGDPDANSPVFLSGNYTLVVQRLLRVLRGIDCYLLVANSRGSNVWCAAGMNEYSEHDVVDAINVAQLGELVTHRRLIAPPYAAPGVDVRFVKRETGFRIIWGPTHLNDIPRYVRNGYRRSYEMTLVQFGLPDRMEQALSTSLAYSMTIAVGALLWPSYVFLVMALILLTYVFSFTLWYQLPEERRWRRTLTVAAALSVPLAVYGSWRNWSAPSWVLWEVTLLGVVALMAMDACGSSPVYKSTISHWLRKGDYHSEFSPIIDPDMCTSCLACQVVCPTGVFAMQRSGAKKMVANEPGNCIECMACVKQCHYDAIFNRTGRYKGDVKSIPNIDYLLTRDTSHLAAEDRWIGQPITVRHGRAFIAEPDDPVALEATKTR
jgi:NAD-dependent dihydropyrimidine dehydrogenase PreA subunit